MQWKSALVGAAIAAVVLSTAGRVFSGDEPEKPVAPDHEAMTKLMQPGAEHEGLAAYAGSWEGSGTMNDVGMPAPMAFTAVQTNEMVLGGRFLQLKEDMTAGEMSSHFVGYVAFDNVMKRYSHFGMGDYSTQPMYAEGKRDPVAKALVLSGVEHVMPGKDRKFRIVVGDVVAGAWKLEMFFDDGTGEKRVVEATYKRKK